MNNEKAIIEKIDYYRSNEIKVHVKIIPKGNFYNGLFVSELKEGKYFWFMCADGIPFRLFLNEIYDVTELKERR